MVIAKTEFDGVIKEFYGRQKSNVLQREGSAGAPLHAIDAATVFMLSGDIANRRLRNHREPFAYSYCARGGGGGDCGDEILGSGGTGFVAGAMRAALCAVSKVV